MSFPGRARVPQVGASGTPFRTPVSSGGAFVRGATAAAPFSPLTYSPTLWLRASDLAQADASAVTSWTDSSGNGLHATQATAGQQPTYRTGVLNGQPVVRFDGGDGLATASTALLSTTPAVTVFVVASVLAATDRVLLEFSENFNSATDGFIVYRTTANKIFSGHKGNASAAVAVSALSTPTLSGTSTFGIICAQSNKAFSMQEVGQSLANNWRYAYAPSGAATVGTHSSTGNFGTYKFNVGARSASGTQTLPTSGDIAEVLVFPRLLSGGEIQNVGAYLAAKYGSSLWNTQTANIVWEGDSLTEGDKLPTSAPPHQVMSRLTDNGVWYAIPAVSGQTLAQMQVDYTTEIKPLRVTTLGTKNVCFLWGGTNDMVSVGGNQTAATTLSRFYSYADTLRADGWYTIGVTMIPRDDAAAPADFEAKRVAFNADVVTNWASHFDALVQPHLLTQFDAEADATNLTYYNADVVHLTAAGYALIADGMETALGTIGIT